MDFKVLVLMALLNLAISMPGPDPGVVVNVNVNVQDNDEIDDPNNGPDNVGKYSDNVKCGVVKSDSTRIVNGDIVNVARKYSWQVGIITEFSKVINGVKANTCGGSIITDSHILTAAHCVCRAGRIDKVEVRIGDDAQAGTTDNLPEFVKPIPAKGIIVHEHFVCDKKPKPGDIAIIILSKPIDLVKHAGVIHPICLPKDDSKTYADWTATITGWGVFEGYTPVPNNAPRPTPLPNRLLEAQISVLDNSRCAQLKPLIIQETMICALSDKDFTEGGTGTCAGDSGGPLFVKEKEKEQHVQIGITSFAAGCGAEQEPSVFTRVSKYLKWIKEQVGSEMIYTLH